MKTLLKTLLRIILVLIFLLIFWPYFEYKKYGNKSYTLKSKTIIISNHYSDFDPFFIYLMFWYKKITFIASDNVKKRFIPHFITWLFDCRYISQDKVNLSTFKFCIEKLDKNGIICIFPEGMINPLKYGLFPFKQSFIYFAKKTHAIILPLYIDPVLKFFGKTKIFIGEEHYFADYNKFKSMHTAAIYFQTKISEYSQIISKNAYKRLLY